MEPSARPRGGSTRRPEQFARVTGRPIHFYCVGEAAPDETLGRLLIRHVAYQAAPEQLAQFRRVSRVKWLRQFRLGLTQAEFAEAFHIPITTLRDWEQHRSTPDAPARALLLAIERDPEVMRRLLADRAA